MTYAIEDRSRLMLLGRLGPVRFSATIAARGR